jgi:hypothetical protein
MYSNNSQDCMLYKNQVKDIVDILDEYGIFDEGEILYCYRYYPIREQRVCHAIIIGKDRKQIMCNKTFDYSAGIYPMKDSEIGEIIVSWISHKKEKIEYEKTNTLKSTDNVLCEKISKIGK